MTHIKVVSLECCTIELGLSVGMFPQPAAIMQLPSCKLISCMMYPQILLGVDGHFPPRTFVLHQLKAQPIQFGCTVTQWDGRKIRGFGDLTNFGATLAEPHKEAMHCMMV